MIRLTFRPLSDLDPVPLLRRLLKFQRPLTHVENVVSILLAWWVMPLTILAFWLPFVPRHDWLGRRFTSS